MDEKTIENIAIPTRGKKSITVKSIWELFDEMRTSDKEDICELMEKPVEWREIPFFPDYKISTRGMVRSYKNGKERQLVPSGRGFYRLFLKGSAYSFHAFFLAVCVFADKFD